jgi:hypothetical protein
MILYTVVLYYTVHTGSTGKFSSKLCVPPSLSSLAGSVHDAMVGFNVEWKKNSASWDCYKGRHLRCRSLHWALVGWKRCTRVAAYISEIKKVGMVLVGLCRGRLLQGNWESWPTPYVRTRLFTWFWSVRLGIGLYMGTGRAVERIC